MYTHKDISLSLYIYIYICVVIIVIIIIITISTTWQGGRASEGRGVAVYLLGPITIANITSY